MIASILMSPWLSRALWIGVIVSSGFIAGMATHKVFADRKVARIEAEHATQRAEQEAAARRALEDAERRAAEVQSRLAKMEARYVKDLQAKDRAIAALNAAGASLRERLAAYTAAASGDVPANCKAPVRDLQDRIEGLGVAVARLDEFAERTATYAEAVSDELRLCRAYATEVSREQTD